MTRAEAVGLRPAELAERLLRRFPHDRIARVEIAPAGEARAPLSYVHLYEQARPFGGRFCTARRIAAVFSSESALPPLRTDPDDVPRRLFTISAQPLLAVLPVAATTERCAAVTRFAQLPPNAPDGGRRVVADTLRIVEQTGRTGRAPIPVTCVDERGEPHSPCDGAAALISLDWATLGNVEAPSSIRGPTTQMWFGGRDHWVLDVTGANQVEHIALRRRYPPPF
jgi:hypothetical protein